MLINNAAIIHDAATLVEFDPDIWKLVLQVNLVAPVFVTQAVLPDMIKRGSGKIINISSLDESKAAPVTHHVSQPNLKISHAVAPPMMGPTSMEIGVIMISMDVGPSLVLHHLT